MERPTRARPPAKKRPPKFTERYFHNVATGYLKQRMTTSAHLKKLLMQRVKKAAEALATEEGKSRAELEREGEGWVDAVLAGLTESGAMDDTAYATAKARGVQDRGGSTRKVAAKLAVTAAFVTARRVSERTV